MAPKYPPKFTSPSKPPESSTMNQYEINEIYCEREKRITEMKNKMDNKMNEKNNEMKRNKEEMENNIDKKMEENKNDMKKKMDENKEEIQKCMKELKNSMSSLIIQNLYEKIPKGDIKIPKTHENKGISHVEQPSKNKKFSSGFNSNSGVNYGGGPKFNLPNIELKKFDET
jgi:hypothetical protein